MSRAPEGVYYAVEDYASLSRRLVIMVVDATVLFVVLVCTLVSYLATAEGSRVAFRAYALAYVFLCFLYLAVLARSRVGTLGYALASVRVVNLVGERPSLAAMAYRALFGAMGPFNAVLDVLWLGGDTHRQALRDKLAGTYVVRRGAQPAGRGRQNRVVVSVFGYTFMVREVNRAVT